MAGPEDEEDVDDYEEPEEDLEDYDKQADDLYYEENAGDTDDSLSEM